MWCATAAAGSLSACLRRHDVVPSCGGSQAGAGAGWAGLLGFVGSGLASARVGRDRVADRLCARTQAKSASMHRQQPPPPTRRRRSGSVEMPRRCDRSICLRIASHRVGPLLRSYTRSAPHGAGADTARGPPPRQQSGSSPPAQPARSLPPACHRQTTPRAAHTVSLGDDEGAMHQAALELRPRHGHVRPTSPPAPETRGSRLLVRTDAMSTVW